MKRWIFALIFSLSYGCLAQAKLDIQSLLKSDQYNVSRAEVLSHFGCQSKRQSIKCRMIYRHLVRDAKSCFIDPSKINNLLELFSKHKSGQVIKVRGANYYLGLVPGQYGYQMSVHQNEVTLNSNIFFKNNRVFDSFEILDYLNKFEQASKRWNRYNPYSFPLKFKLNWAKNRSFANITSKLLRKKTRGPYFWKWSHGWSYKVISHEFAHMMGLDDEYSNNPFGGSQKSCDKASIMCSSSKGVPQEYHYYLILRRAFCAI